MKILKKDLNKIISKFLLEVNPADERISGMDVTTSKINKKESDYVKMIKNFKKIYIDGKGEPHGKLLYIQFSKDLPQPLDIIKNAKIKINENKIYDRGNYVTIMLHSKLIKNIKLTVKKDTLVNDWAIFLSSESDMNKIYGWNETKEGILSFKLLCIIAAIGYNLVRTWYYLMSNPVDINLTNLDKKLKKQMDNMEFPIEKYPEFLSQYKDEKQPVRKFFENVLEDLRNSTLNVQIDIEVPFEKEDMPTYYHPMMNLVRLNQGDEHETVTHELNHMFKSKLQHFNELSKILNKTNIESTPWLGNITDPEWQRRSFKFLFRNLVGKHIAGKNDAENFIKWYAKTIAKQNPDKDKIDLAAGLRISQMESVKLPDLDFRTVEDFIANNKEYNNDKKDKYLDEILAVKLKGKKIPLEGPMEDYVSCFYCLQDDHILELGIVLSRMMLYQYDYKEKEDKKISVRDKKTYNIFSVDPKSIKENETKRKKYVKEFVKTLMRGEFKMDSHQHIDQFQRGSKHYHDLRGFKVIKETNKNIKYFVSLILDHV